jgi:hypothetical protein
MEAGYIARRHPGSLFATVVGTATTVKTDEPCAGCGEPIQPGQLYAVLLKGHPAHFGCVARADR